MSDDSPSDPTPGPHPTRDALRRYLDEELPPDESTAVGEHLERCETCVEALDELSEPAPLPATNGAPLTYDARWMRRAMRRTLLSLAWRTAVLLVVVAVGANLLGVLVIDPILINRGGRTPAHVTASVDLPVMMRPGAEIREFTSNSGVIRRTTEVEVERAVGAEQVSLGRYETRLGPLDVSMPSGTFITPRMGPRLSEDAVDHSPVTFLPDRFGEGTAVTVELVWYDTIDRGTAARLHEDHDAVALTWVGFALPDQEHEDPWSRLGYGACAVSPERIGTPSMGGFGRGGFRAPPGEPRGPDQALEQLRRATENLAQTGWLEGESMLEEHPLGDVQATATWLRDNDPDVASVVLTGATDDISEIVSASEPDTAYLLDVDFDRGPPEPCG